MGLGEQLAARLPDEAGLIGWAMTLAAALALMLAALGAHLGHHVSAVALALAPLRVADQADRARPDGAQCRDRGGQ